MLNKKQYELIDLIKDLLVEYPDLRFCQLIQNCFGTEDIYNVTDEELKNRLKETYNTKKQEETIEEFPNWGWWD